MHAPRSVLDEEQHVQGSQPRRLDGEEIARHDSLRLRAQQLAPRRSLPTRSRTETRASDDRSDCRRAHPDAKLAQFALDPHAAPPRVLTRQAQHQLTKRGSSGGRPGKRRRYVHFLATSSRCQRNSVCGETRNTDQRLRGSSVLTAASNIRSLRRNGGRFTVLPNTPSW
jgi:hypothetical protein